MITVVVSRCVVLNLKAMVNCPAMLSSVKVAHSNSIFNRSSHLKQESPSLFLVIIFSLRVKQKRKSLMGFHQTWMHGGISDWAV